MKRGVRGRKTGVHRDLQKHLYDEAGRLRSFVNVYVNDEDVRYLSQDETTLAPGDVKRVLDAVRTWSARH